MPAIAPPDNPRLPSATIGTPVDEGVAVGSDVVNVIEGVIDGRTTPAHRLSALEL